MNLPQLGGPSPDRNPGDALVKAWDVFKTGLGTDVRTGAPDFINPNLIPRLIVMLTEDAGPTTGPDQAQTEAIAQLIEDGQFSGDANNLAVTIPSDVPHTINIMTIGMCERTIKCVLFSVFFCFLFFVFVFVFFFNFDLTIFIFIFIFIVRILIFFWYFLVGVNVNAGQQTFLTNVASDPPVAFTRFVNMFGNLMQIAPDVVSQICNNFIRQIITPVPTETPTSVCFCFFFSFSFFLVIIFLFLSVSNSIAIGQSNSHTNKITFSITDCDTNGITKC